MIYGYDLFLLEIGEANSEKDTMLMIFTIRTTTYSYKSGTTCLTELIERIYYEKNM